MRYVAADHLVLSMSNNMTGARGSWTHLKQQTGMFGFLGLTPEVVTRLRGKLVLQVNKTYFDNQAEEFHIYMASNSRVSIAGLNVGNVEYVARSIKACLEEDAC